MFEYMDGIVDAVEEIGQAAVDVTRPAYFQKILIMSMSRNIQQV